MRPILLLLLPLCLAAQSRIVVNPFPPGSGLEYIPTPSTGPGSPAVSRECVFSGAGTCLVTHSLGTTTPLIGQPIVNSGCASCYTIGTFTSNTFTVTSTQAADLIFPIAYAGAPPADFSLVVGAASVSPVFQNSPTSTTFLISQTAISGYAGTTTLSLNAVTGITCTFVPTTISGTGTSTATCPVTASSTSNTTTGASNTMVFHATDGSTAHDASGVALLVWTTPVQQWLMSEGSGLTFADSSGHANTVTAGSGMTWGTFSGIPGSAAHFSGGQDAIAANLTAFNPGGTTPWTISTWVTFDNANNSNNEFIFSQQSTNPGFQLYKQITGATATGWTFVVVDNSGGFMSFTSSVAPVSATLYNVVASVDGTHTQAGMKVYVNGVAQTATATHDTMSASMTMNTVPYLSSWAFNTANRHTGYQADSRMFLYTFSSTQVAAIYAAGAKQ